MASKLAKSKTRIGHGPGYTLDKVKYPRGASSVVMKTDKHSPLSTISKGYTSTNRTGSKKVVKK